MLKTITTALISGAAAAALLGAAAPAQAQTPQLKVRNKLQYVHGMNIGWMFGRYSTDLGINPLHPDWGNGYDSAQTNAWMNDLKLMKVNVVRLWLFEGMEGLNFDSQGRVTGVQTQFMSNLDDVMAKANTHGLAVELTFLNYDIALQVGQDPPGAAGPIKNMVTESTARQRFIDNVIKPIALRYKNNLALFGYDLINESNQGDGWAYTWNEMRTFASQATAAIKSQDSDAQVTMSTQWWAFYSQNDHPYLYGGLGLDYYNFHQYVDSPNLPSPPAWLDKPLVLGEFGPGTTQGWTDQAMATNVNQHVSQASSRGWAGAMAWMYWHSTGNQENYATTPGGVQAWRPAGVRMKAYGNQFFGPKILFGDSIANGWVNSSTGCTVNFDSTSPIKVGSKAARVNSTAGNSRFSLTANSALATAGKTRFRFWVHGGSSGQNLKFFVSTTTSATSTGDFNFTVAANEWKQITVNLSAIGNPATVRRVFIQNRNSTGSGVHSIDHLRLE